VKIPVLIVGGTGMLGHKLVQVLGADAELEVHATVRRLPEVPFVVPSATYHEGVVLGPAQPRLAEVLRRVKPRVVINAVGAIKQRDLYAQMEETFYLNASLPHLIPFFDPEHDVRVIHFSTDCVFLGDRGGYTEADAPDALDLYGRSKACGEIDYGNHLTIRTSIIGFELASHLGLLGWFLRQPRGSQLQGYSKAIYSGLPTATLSRTVLDIVKHRPELRGLYHIASEPIDKLVLLERVNRRFDLGHSLTPNDAVRIDRSIDDTRFRTATGTARPGWDELVEELAEDFRAYPYDEVYGLGVPAGAAPASVVE
jgi:dTDP-4-dehydrorhamnose reductase